MDRDWIEPEKAFETPPTGLSTRAFLKIQEGCNSFCTYCIIPYGRGPSRSLSPRELIEQVKSLVRSGVREIILTGTNIGDYGTDWESEPQLAMLLKMILKETDLERLRVSSLDPTEITAEIFELMLEEPRFCPHFHVSLQSASDRVLKLMKRRYGVAQVESCLRKIAEIPDTFVGMDVITGFPGETDAEFKKTLQVLESSPWSRLHVFPYSEREGTPATRLGEVVPKAERARRAKILQDLSLKRLEKTYQRYAHQLLKGVLLERARAPHGYLGEWLAGYTPNYLRVFVPASENARRNDLVDVRVGDAVLEAASGDAYFIAASPGRPSPANLAN
jgi:threonylcarbamoyladenosine tRNA methylthiotransferase MtaB